MINRITQTLTKIFFPSYCYLCRSEGASVCNTCLSQRKRAYDSPYPWIVSLYSFKDPCIKKIIHAIKYFHRKDLIAPLSSILSETIVEEGIELQACVLMPIPMTQLRKYIRGYNHAEVLANYLSKELQIPVEKNILTRSIAKKQQVKTKTRSERLKNQHNAFLVQKTVTGMHIILIDDVTTTGATLLEARKVLLEKGAAEVKAYTLAH